MHQLIDISISGIVDFDFGKCVKICKLKYLNNNTNNNVETINTCPFEFQEYLITSEFTRKKLAIFYSKYYFLI